MGQLFNSIISLVLIFIIILNCKWVFTRWQWYYNKTQHTSHKITHQAQTKHSTQNYTHNKGHTTHNECNAKFRNTDKKYDHIPGEEGIYVLLLLVSTQLTSHPVRRQAVNPTIVDQFSFSE
jgi:ABC-type nickel/cobalt efflux system permease component RcnA